MHPILKPPFWIDTRYAVSHYVREEAPLIKDVLKSFWVYSCIKSESHLIIWLGWCFIFHFLQWLFFNSWYSFCSILWTFFVYDSAWFFHVSIPISTSLIFVNVPVSLSFAKPLDFYYSKKILYFCSHFFPWSDINHLTIRQCYKSRLLYFLVCPSWIKFLFSMFYRFFYFFFAWETLR